MSGNYVAFRQLFMVLKDKVWDKPNTMYKSTLMKVAISGLQLVYDSNWFTCISRANYAYSDTFQQENYVVFFNRVTRSAFTKSSAHCFRIEKGRYSIPKITPEERIL